MGREREKERGIERMNERKKALDIVIKHGFDKAADR